MVETDRAFGGLGHEAGEPVEAFVTTEIICYTEAVLADEMSRRSPLLLRP